MPLFKRKVKGKTVTVKMPYDKDKEDKKINYSKDTIKSAMRKMQYAMDEDE